MAPLLQIAHRSLMRSLLGQASLTADQAECGAVALIQRFGSAVNLNIHLHCLVLAGVYRRGTDGEPDFVEVHAPSYEAPQAMLLKIITRTMEPLTRRGAVIEVHVR
jgi:hypothetical protein